MADVSRRKALGLLLTAPVVAALPALLPSEPEYFTGGVVSGVDFAAPLPPGTYLVVPQYVYAAVTQKVGETFHISFTLIRSEYLPSDGKASPTPEILRQPKVSRKTTCVHGIRVCRRLAAPHGGKAAEEALAALKSP